MSLFRARSLAQFVNVWKSEVRPHFEDGVVQVFDVESMKYKYSSLHGLSELMGGFMEKGKQLDPTWVDVHIGQDSMDALLQSLSSLPLHPLTVEDISEAAKRPKAEHYDSYLHVVLAEDSVMEESNLRMTTHLDILLFHNFIISIHVENCNLVPATIFSLTHDSVRPDGHLGPDWILYKFLLSVKNHFDAEERAIELLIESLDSKVDIFIEDSSEELLQLLTESKRRVQRFQRMILIQIEVCLSLVPEQPTRLISEEAKIYIRDILSHVTALKGSMESANWQIINFHESVVAAVTLKLNIYQVETNAILKRYSAMATILMPLTFMTGVFGMNIFVPFVNGLNQGVLYFVYVIVLMFLFALIMIIYFKKKSWL